ncbi:MAG: GtrA family protein [Janthinobacterium lividum]
MPASTPSGARKSPFRALLTYAAVGAAGTAAQYVVLFALLHAGLAQAPVASALGAVVGAIVNYFLNHAITFSGQASHRDALPRFALIALLGAVFSYLAMKGIMAWGGVPVLLAQLVVTAALLVLTFAANALWSFRRVARP